MAEVQTSTNAGEVTQQFIEFLLMHAQNAALIPGKNPTPQTAKGEVNLEVAKMFIDQLAMIQEKTRGNLSSEESAVLRNTLSNLQLAYVEVSRGASSAAPAERKAPESAPPEEPATPESPTAGPEGESRKKFTKSYGAG